MSTEVSPREARAPGGPEPVPRAGGRQRRVLILSASMGGGHMQVSRELARRFSATGWSVEVMDVLDLTPRWGRFLHWFYPWMVNRAPWLYELIYQGFFTARQRGARRASIPVRLSLPGLRRAIERRPLDLVVSTYHLAGVAAARLRSSGALAAPAVTFVTTFGVHDLWLHPGTDLYLCITPQAAERLRRRVSAPVMVSEPVVRPQFTAAGRNAGSGDGRPGAGVGERPGAGGGRTALVVAGSLGLGRVKEAVRIIAGLPGWVPVAACGTNESLRSEVERIAGARSYGWTDDMAALIAASDVLIDNAAGSTAKEALAAGCPVVTFDPIAGHGRDDAARMQEAGLTEVVTSAAQLADALERVASGSAGRARAARGRSLFGADPVRLLGRWLDERSHVEAS